MKQPIFPSPIFDPENPTDEALDEALEFIRDYDVTLYGFRAIIPFLIEIWFNSKNGFVFNEKTGRLSLATGGWSDNEMIIDAFRDNIHFWSVCWQKTERGGRYVLKLPKK